MTIPEDVRIKKAEYMGDYVIRFTFTDGHISTLDLHPFLSAAGQNPMNSQYLDVLRFRQFKVHRDVDVYWDDWEMCFRFETLYSGKLPKFLSPKSRPTKRASVSKRARVKT
jgi:hypothetical protein